MYSVIRRGSGSVSQATDLGPHHALGQEREKSRFAFSIGHLLKLSILFILFIHNLLTGSLPEHGCKKKVISRDFFLQVENILKRFDCEYLLTVTLGGNNK